MLWLQWLFTSSQNQVPALSQHTFGGSPSNPPLKNSQIPRRYIRKKIQFSFFQFPYVMAAAAVHFFAEPSTCIVSTHLWWVAQQSASQKFAEMPPKQLYLSDTHRRGARARKDQRNAKDRAAYAAAVRKEVGDIQEDVVPYQHKGGQVGKTIRLKRMNPSSVSGDAAQPAPQLPLPVASPPPQAPAPAPQPLPHLAAIHASLDRLSPHERRKLLAERTQRELKKGQLCISTGGCAKHALYVCKEIQN
jgi:hypothetical protein